MVLEGGDDEGSAAYTGLACGSWDALEARDEAGCTVFLAHCERAHATQRALCVLVPAARDV